MGWQNFATLVDDLFDDFRVSPTPDEIDGENREETGELDELFDNDESPGNGTVEVRWTASPPGNAPDLNPILNLARREEMRLADRSLSFSEGGWEFPRRQKNYQEASITERLTFVEAEDD